MKRSIQLLTAVIGFALGSASVQAALSYWDSNGTTNGAGDTPNGVWDPAEPPYFWSTNSAGASATNTWVDGDTAVFSAGTDAANAFTVTINGYPFAGAPSAGGLTFEEGEVTLSGGGIMMTNEFEFPIVVTNKAIIGSNLQQPDSASGTCGIRKSGPGTLTLSGSNPYGAVGCTNTVAEGVLVFTSASSLGSTPLVTIVSNGAALVAATSQNFGCPVILHGSGVTNSGALRGTSGSPQWQGGAQLYSDARINWDGGGDWNWISPYYNIEGIAGGSNFNLTIGGNGGKMRLNMAHPYNRAVNLGTGKLIKEGTFILQFENGTICSGFYLNGGGVYPRGGITTIGSPGASIYVGTNACGFYALFESCTISTPISLAAGANLWFEPRYYNFNTLAFTYTGVMSGLGGVTVRGDGRTVFTKANTYTGNTIIQGGSLVLSGSSASIANSAVIDMQQTGADLDVSTVTNALGIGKFVLGADQTLKGSGTVYGNVTANGTLAPEALSAFGNLTFNDDLTLAAGAKLSIKVDRAGFPTSDTITVLGTVCTNAGAGTVLVTNAGAALEVGDSFPIFSPPLLNGQALAVVGGGVVWTNKLAQDGSIAVLRVLPPQPPPTNLTVAALSPASFKLRALGGPNQAYSVHAYTNVATPVANWWLLGTVFADAGGVVQFVDTQATNRQRFYRLATVAVAPPRVAATNLSIAKTVPAGFNLRGLGGPNLTYGVYAATNLTPPASWVLIGNTVADAAGVIQFVDPQAATRQRFYRFGQ